MKRAVLLISAICFTEITSAEVATTEYFKIHTPDALYVNTLYISDITLLRSVNQGTNNFFIKQDNPIKKKKSDLPSIATNNVAILSEKNFSQKRMRKKRPFTNTKREGNNIYHPVHLHTQFALSRPPPSRVLS